MLVGRARAEGMELTDSVTAAAWLRDTLEYIVRCKSTDTTREQLIAAVALERFGAGDAETCAEILHALPKMLGR